VKKKIPLYLLEVLLAALYIVPFYILIGMSLKKRTDMSSKWVFPHYLYLDNFANACNEAHLYSAIVNNVIITIGALIILVVFGSAASYPLARNRTKINSVIYTMIISCMIVPALTILVPLYKFIMDINGINTYWALILLQVTFSLPLTIFLYTGFIGSVSRTLDEAALIDGCSKIGIFFRIILPLLKPITATVIILTGVGIWNDYQFSLFFLQSEDMQTITVALSSFISQFSNNISYVAAGCLIGMIPMAALYLFLQRYFIKGLSDGAVKG
jgi:raffinose/stachyose/melibiose transport system permease protein